MKKKKNYLRKPANDLEKLDLGFSEEGKEGKIAGQVGVFFQNLGIAAYTLGSYSIFKNKFLFNSGTIFQINDYYKARRNESFTEFSKIINTLSN